MNEEQLKTINDAIRNLRDYFEAQGATFIFAWWTRDENSSTQDFNTISTSAKGSDYAEAILRWAGQLEEYIKED